MKEHIWASATAYPHHPRRRDENACNCGQMQNFWEQAAKWYEILIGINPPLGLKVYRLFGQEKERPDDLNNIFYRTVRYAIFISRKYALGPTLEALEELLLDEFDRKYRRDRWKKYEKDPYEYKAIMFLKIVLWSLDPG